MHNKIKIYMTIIYIYIYNHACAHTPYTTRALAFIVASPCAAVVESPKSTTFTGESGFMFAYIMFSGLRSRCTMFCRCVMFFFFFLIRECEEECEEE